MPEPTTNAAPRDHAAQELRALLDAAVDAIIVIDAAGRIETFNPAAEKLFGFTEQEMVGQQCQLLMPEPDRSAHDDYLRRYLATGEARIIGIGREVLGTAARRLDVSGRTVGGPRGQAPSRRASSVSYTICPSASRPRMRWYRHASA